MSSCHAPEGDCCSLQCRAQDKEHPKYLIPELCKQFYHLGWVTGTGGGISLKHGNEIYIAPSGVQKERIQPEDLFVCDINEKDISGPPPYKNLKKSQCTPLFMNAYTMRGAGAVIHTHSKAAVMATLLFPGREFKITHQEMIKGIKKCISGGYYSWLKYFPFDEENCHISSAIPVKVVRYGTYNIDITFQEAIRILPPKFFKTGLQDKQNLAFVSLPYNL
ncbi:methylthioribulose-1-phosphate dehydratase isoform X2 [Lagenorhynchus albirostris]|uniref:methylthioribulose-1-phosphate dehydratase isoform X2 n=1 Tax=Lagenorhynchus albirostris TaxID=27610 RepID=UPI0028EC9043|nr:methylthioribulose-1-phosphate dehydratase isoform X2 [Lagenorhynchus albirostris]